MSEPQCTATHRNESGVLFRCIKHARHDYEGKHYSPGHYFEVVNSAPASAAGRERETARGNDGREWNRQPGVDCVECPDCGFTFDAAHRDEDGTYSCPNCLAPERGGEEETP